MNTIQTLPHDMHRTIAGLLQPCDLVSLGAVSRLFRTTVHQVADNNEVLKKELEIAHNVRNRRYRLARRALGDDVRPITQQADVAGFGFVVRNHVLHCSAGYTLGRFIHVDAITVRDSKLYVDDGHDSYYLDFKGRNVAQHIEDWIFSLAITRFFRHCYRIVIDVIVRIVKRLFDTLMEMKATDPGAVFASLLATTILLPLDIYDQAVLTYNNRNH